MSEIDEDDDILDRIKLDEGDRPDEAGHSFDRFDTFESLRSSDRSNIDPERAGVSEQEKLDSLERSLGEIRELRPEEWRSLDDLERRQAVERGVEAIAREYGIERPDVVLTEGAPRLQGYYSSDSHTLYLNTNAADRDGASAWDNPGAVMETAAHETRHAYQHAAVRDYEEGRGSDPRAAEWRDNFNDYITPEQDYAEYRDQPVEQDARAFGASVRRRMYG
jgi:hypothetical protein